MNRAAVMIHLAWKKIAKKCRGKRQYTRFFKSMFTFSPKPAWLLFRQKSTSAL